MIQGFRFRPADLSVDVGDTVTWRNEDGDAHTVTGADDDAPGDSGDLNQGGEFQFNFTEPGTYEYVCTIHASLHATIVVGER